MYEGLINKYSKYLAVEDKSKIVTLNEGNTLFLRLKNLPSAIGLKNANVYVKFEGLNPTGSFKDRGMTMAVTKANEAGSKAVICASTGNTSASAAAYAAVGHHLYAGVPADKLKLHFKMLPTVRHGVKIRHGAHGGVATRSGAEAAALYCLLIRKTRLSEMHMHITKSGKNNIFL